MIMYYCMQKLKIIALLTACHMMMKDISIKMNSIKKEENTN